MAVGIINKNVTLTGIPTGAVDVQPLGFLVDSTTTPTRFHGLSHLVDSTGVAILGDRTDVANTATNATALTMMQVLKQLSASLQALSTAIGTGVLDRNGGPATSNTLRTTIDTLQLDPVIAHGVDDATSAPYKMGMRAIAHGTNPTAVAAHARTDWLASRAGVPWMIGGHPNVVTRGHMVTDTDGLQNNFVLLSVAAGLKVVVTQLSAVMDASNTTDVGVRIGIAPSGTGLPVPSAAGNNGILLSGKWSANCGQQKGNGAGIVGVGADGEDLLLTCDDPVGGAVRVTYSYYTIES